MVADARIGHFDPRCAEPDGKCTGFGEAGAIEDLSARTAPCRHPTIGDDDVGSGAGGFEAAAIDEIARHRCEQAPGRPTRSILATQASRLHAIPGSTPKRAPPSVASESPHMLLRKAQLRLRRNASRPS